MDPDIAYFADVLLAFMGLFYVVYIVFGKVKNRALIGGYSPGKVGYDVFRKIIATKYLVLSSALTVFFTVNAILDARRALEDSYSSSILIGTPVFVAILFGAIIFVSSRIFSKK